MRIDPLPSVRRRIVLTPLIDVIFLLLLFFMLSSSFLKFGKIDLTGASSGSIASSATPDILIRVEPAGAATINGGLAKGEEIDARLAAMKAEGAKRVAVSVSADADVQALVKLLEQLKSYRFESVSVVQ